MEAALIATLGGILAVFSALIPIWVRRRNERKSLNSAVRAEIDRLEGLLRAHDKWWRDCQRKANIDSPLIHFETDVYDAHKARLGELDGDLIEYAVKFYGRVKFLNALQDVRPIYEGISKQEEFIAVYQTALEGTIGLRQELLGVGEHGTDVT